MIVGAGEKSISLPSGPACSGRKRPADASPTKDIIGPASPSMAELPDGPLAAARAGYGTGRSGGQTDLPV